MSPRRTLLGVSALLLSACSQPAAQPTAQPDVTPPNTLQATKTPKPVTQAPPKDCVEDPKRDAASRLQEDPSSPELELLQIPDLDNDDVQEQAHSLPGPTGVGVYHLYLSRNSCWKYAGKYTGYDPDPLPTSTQGVRDVRIWLPDGCLNMEGTLTTYQWDGNTFQPKTKIYCACPKDSGARDPLCPKSQ